MLIYSSLYNAIIKYNFLKNLALLEFPLWLCRLRTGLVSMRMWVQSLALLSGSRIWCCQEPQHRSQMLLRCRLATVPPIQPLAWELSYAMGMKVKKKNKTKLF